MAGKDAVASAVAAGELAGLGEAPPLGDGRDRVTRGRISQLEVAMGLFEPEPPQIAHRAGVQVAGDCVVHGPAVRAGGLGHVPKPDRLPGMGLHMGDGPAKCVGRHRPGPQRHVRDGHDDPGETAKRELEEETGYVCSSVERLISGPTSPGITTETVAFYRAMGLSQRGMGGGVGGEDITVHRVPRGSIVDWLKRKADDGILIDVKIWAGLWWLSVA